MTKRKESVNTEAAESATEILRVEKQPTPEQELWDWWVNQGRREANMVVPKSVEYGANSLTRLGHSLGSLAGRHVSDEEAIELGVWVYLVGKVERWTDAVIQGRRPNDDILLDIGIYAKMAQRNREVGSWPGTPRREQF